MGRFDRGGSFLGKLALPRPKSLPAHFLYGDATALNVHAKKKKKVQFQFQSPKRLNAQVHNRCKRQNKQIIIRQMPQVNEVRYDAKDEG